jgi:hypothetical protein
MALLSAYTGAYLNSQNIRLCQLSVHRTNH